MNKKEPPVKVIFENEKVLIVDKPAGVLVIPDQHIPYEQTMTGLATEYAGHKIFTVHRIDRDTTGVLAFAKDADTHIFMCKQFETGSVSKKYNALLGGVISEDSGIIDKPIRIEGREVSIDRHGKESITHFRVLKRFRDFCFVEAEPKTGRRHQIRLHFWSLGHPLAVDKEYGARDALFLSDFKKKYKSSGKDKERPLMGRLSLHAKELTFKDPVTMKQMTVSSPLPDDFELTLKLLEKYN